MAIGHISFDDQTNHGRQLRRGLQQLEEGLNGLNDLISIMDQMKDNGQITSYLQGKFGFADISSATAAYDELSSMLSKLNTDAQVEFTHAAITQAFHKFG